MKKKLSLADIKAGILIDTPEKITVEIMVSGEPCEFETHIKIMDYSTAIAQMQANQEKKEALASILADCIVNEDGEPEFTEAEIRQHFSKPLIDAVWAEILKKNFLGKATAKQNLKEKNSGQSLSSTALEVEPLPKPSETLVTENISTGGSTESAEEA
ncbi:phage tail assembly chaperone family protein, TAC [Acinetobacter sp. WCHAc060007]|uniref:phage tail assembly chaperone family protein, TAC n=1 Tax=Acinetobacter sp. WCHAc060007 TaxID=2419605 RepID=UPI000EA2A03F|nr:phage tail assembly chaperone family protein, TAC [Acinetobacter sp. WCHAc060007]RKG38662.1 hypothetical protein D7V31_15085 [Acinetobacter sp. WCHAc060007]